MRKEKKLLLIEWVDSHSSNRWEPMDELAKDTEPLYCRTVGWEVAHSCGMTHLVSSISGEKNATIREYGTGNIVIPDKNIVKRTVLRTSRRRS